MLKQDQGYWIHGTIVNEKTLPLIEQPTKKDRMKKNKFLGYTIEILMDSLASGENWDRQDKREAAIEMLASIRKELLDTESQEKDNR